MKLMKQIRSLSMFRKHIKDFNIDTQNYAIIDPVLATKISPDNLSRITKQNIHPDYILKSLQEDHEEDKLDENNMIIHDNDEIESIRESCSIASHCLRLAPDLLKPGSTTLQLNEALHQEIISRNAYPSVLGYKNFPKSISTSVNNVACHGIPDDRPLESGDIISVDVNVYKDGFHGVSGSTFIVGDSRHNPLVRYLRSVAQECLFRGISVCRPGTLIMDIGAEIDKFARRRHINIIPSLIGNGIGRYFHSHPEIYHVLNNYPGQMKPGKHY